MAICFFGSGLGFVNWTQSDPGFVNPVRSSPGFVSPIRSGPGFVNALSKALFQLFGLLFLARVASQHIIRIIATTSFCF